MQEFKHVPLAIKTPLFCAPVIVKINSCKLMPSEKQRDKSDF